MSGPQVLSFPHLFTDADDVILLLDHEKDLTYYLKVGIAGVAIERYPLNINHTEKTLYFGDMKLDMQYGIMSVKTSLGPYIDIPQLYDRRDISPNPVEIVVHPKHKYLGELIQVVTDGNPYWFEFCKEYGLKIELKELEPKK